MTKQKHTTEVQSIHFRNMEKKKKKKKIKTKGPFDLYQPDPKYPRWTSTAGHSHHNVKNYSAEVKKYAALPFVRGTTFS